MHCPSCGAKGAPEARFCATCGAHLPVAVPVAPVPFAPVHVFTGPDARVVLCPRCGQRTTPLAYFARGANVAKAVVLMLTPLTIVGSAVFFFWRKDRFVCTSCRGLLPESGTVPLLGAFSAGTAMSASPAAHTEQHLLRSEVAFLENRGRRGRARAWMLGALAGGFFTLGAAAAIDGNTEPLPVTVTLTGVFGGAAALTGRRGRKALTEAEAKRARADLLLLLELARRCQGRLTVTAVATELGRDFREAEMMLDRVYDGRRVDIETDADGRMTYVFTEIARALPPAG